MNPDPLQTLPKVGTGQTPTKLTKEEYLKRWRQRFYDPAFEMSKTFRLAQSAREIIDAVPRFEVDFLHLSVMAAEYGRVIYLCKACVSTAMPLCHWPCSCYPNHYLGQFAGLDESDLPAMGGGTRHHDRYAAALVPGPQHP